MGKLPRFQKERNHRHTDWSAQPNLWDEDQLYERLRGWQEPLLLVLDCVQDPHNLGACIRSADAAGVAAVVVPKDKSVGLTDVARRVACGGAEHTPFVAVTNLARCMDRLKEQGVWLVGTADEAAKEVHGIDLTGPIGIVMGAEGEGLRRLTREKCDFLARIPMSAGAKVTCLNVSVATGVMLFEVLRQRAAKREKSVR